MAAVALANRQLISVSAAPGDVAQLGTPDQVTGSDTLPGYVVPAGTNRVLIVTASEVGDTDIDGVTFDGQPLTFAVSYGDGATDSIWFLVLGTSASSITGDIVVTGLDSTQSFITAQSYEFVDQGNPIAASEAQQIFETDASSDSLIATSLGDLVFDIFDAFSSTGDPNRFISGPLRTTLHDADIVTTAPVGQNGWTTSILPGAAVSVTMSWTSTAESVIHVAITLNNDPNPPPLQLNIDDVSLAEGDAATTAFTFTVSLEAPAGPGGVTFDIATQDDSAIQPGDYAQKSLTSQTIPQGETEYSFVVLVNGDVDQETAESFFVNVTNIVGATAGDTQGTGTIQNDDTASCTVTSALDSGAGTLREKVADTNCAAIDFDLVAMGTTTIALASPLASVSRTLTITGQNRQPVISGDGTFRLLQNLTGGDLTLTSLTVSGFGTTTSNVILGGAIYNQAVLSIVGSTFTDNSIGNSLGNGSHGGAIYSVAGSSLSISGSTFEDNQAIADLASSGGAIYADGSLSITNSTFSGNEAGYGGAIAKDAGAAWTIANSTFNGNSSNKTNQSGGAIETRVPVTITNSTLTGNTAGVAGAIEASGSSAFLTLIHTTISGNTATSGTAAGIRSGNVIPNVSNSIIADNTGTDCQAIPGMNDTGHNLDSDGTCSFDITGDPDLGPLANNGGPTETMAIGLASDARDAADDTICAAAPVNNLDQRGETRPFGTHCDLGAYEAQGQLCTVTSALDSGPGTLREKVADAGCAAIDFNLVAMGTTTITLDSTLPAVDRELSITGQNRLPVIDGDDAVLLMSVTVDGDLTLTSLTLSNGKSATGGAIYSEGALDIEDCLFEDNTSESISGSASGGAILAWIGSTTTVRTSTFLRNKAVGITPPILGGAIHTRGELSVSDSTFEENEALDGGAIQCLSACSTNALEVSGSTFAGNKANGSGGALQGSGAFHVKNSTFFNNEAPVGGAIRADSAGLYSVTMAGNTATAGSAISMVVEADADTSLFVNNNGPACDGLIAPGQSMSTDNTCAATLVAGPFALGSLQDNGGPTHTMALPPGSPAINAGPATCASAPIFGVDQRGVARPIGPACDLGAYEAPLITAVTINVPAGVSYSFNSVNYTGTQTINVAPGNYTLSTTTPQLLSPGTRAVFASWSDLGAMSHSVAVASTPFSITGFFSIEFLLTTSAGVGGTVTPPTGFYGANTLIPVQATPNPGFEFVSWSGPVANPTSASTTVEMMVGPATITAIFAGLPDLSLTKTVNNAAPFVGETVTFAITVWNTGNAPANGIVVDDSLPVGLELVSTSASQGSVISAPPLLTWNVGTVNPGFSATLQVTAKVLSAATITNVAEIIAEDEDDADSTPDDGTGDDRAAVSLTSTVKALLSITKSNGVGSVNPGSTVNYVVTITNAGPSPADGATVADPAVPGMTKTAITQCSFNGGATCPSFGNAAGQLGIANLEAGTVVIPLLPAGGSINFTVAVTITASAGQVTNAATATPPAGTSGGPVTAYDSDAVIDTQPPVVGLTGPVDGGSYTLGNVPPAVCTTSDPPPGSGVQVPASPVYSGGNVNGAGTITASCVGGKDNAGNVAPPVSVTYTVTCLPSVTYSGVVGVKVGASVPYTPVVTAVVSLNPTTCAVTNVALSSASNATGAIQLNTVLNWKAPVQPAAGQWSFAMKTVNAATGGIFLNSAYRAMDGSSKLLVKFINNRQGLYLKLTGMAPTGIGINKAGFEAESASLALVP